MEILKTMLRDPDEGSGGEGAPAPKVKTYNLDEVNGIVGERLARERTGIYSKVGVKDEKELIDIFGKAKTLEEENATLKAENEEFKASQAKAEKFDKLKQAGIDPDFIEIAADKWDGEEDLEKFTAEHPKFRADYFDKFKGTGGTLGNKGGGSVVDESQMTTAEFMEYKKKRG